MDKAKSKILVLVEGAKTDVRLMKHLLSIYGIDENHEIIPYNTNIYTLYNEMFRDDDPNALDLLQVLKARERDPEKKVLFDVRYSDVLLIFDLDPQDPQYSPDKIKQMSAFFVESSDMGKLYFNYPMVESFYHMKSIPDIEYFERIVSMHELISGTYKARVNQENRNRNYAKFATTKDECNTVIVQNLQKAKNLITSELDVSLLQNTDVYTTPPDTTTILRAQLAMITKTNTLAALCTCAFYIVEYNPKLLSREEATTGYDDKSKHPSDLFYSQQNIAHLENVVSKINAGGANLVEHKLIEANE